MPKFQNHISRYISDESGATAIEYALIAALIGIGIIAGATSMAGSTNQMFTDTDAELGKAFNK